MPSDDVILNVRQVAGYPRAASPSIGDAILLQRGGLGGPYAWIDPATLVSKALINGGDFFVGGGSITTQSLQAGAIRASNAAIALLGAERAQLTQLDAQWGSINGVPIATMDDLGCLDAALRASSVWSVNGRRGDILLTICDVPGAAPIFSPRFQGEPRAPTAEWCDNSSRIATTAWVTRSTVLALNNLLNDHPFVFTFNGRSGDVVLTADDIANAGEVFNDVQLTGTPTAPTAAPGDNSDTLATTAFVADAITTATAGLADVYAPINSPTFTGYPSGPTAAPGSSTGQFATTAFVMNAITEATAGVATFNGRTGAVELETADVTAVGAALLASPAFTGAPSGPTQAPGTANTTLATTAFVMAALSGVEGVASFNARTGAVTLTTADITAAGGAPLASPVFTGTPAAPTASPGASTTQLATTAFVAAAVAAAGGVTTFNGRAGAITLTSADVSAAGGAPLASPPLTGTPTAPTAATGTNTNQLATTAFVLAELATGGGVDSFNGRAGAVTLTPADVLATGALAAYLPLAGGTMTGALALASAGIVGVTDGSDAPTGAIGEVLSTTVTSGPVLATGVAATVATLALTAGDWDIAGELWINNGTAASTTCAAAISTSATFPQTVNLETPRTQLVGSPANSPMIIPLRMGRVSLAAGATIYLLAVAFFASGSASTAGVVWARRAR